MKKGEKYTEFFADLDHDDLRGKAVKGAGATILSNGSIFLIQLLGTMVLARLLTPDDFGLIAMVAAFSYLLMNFGNRGFTEAIVQAEHINHEMVSNIFWIHFGITLVLMLVFTMFAPVIARLYNEPKITGIAVAFTLTFLFTMLSTHHLALLARKMDFFKIMLIEVGANLFSVVIAIYMAAYGFNHWALVTRRVSIPFGMFVGGWLLCKWVPGLYFGIQRIGKMFKFSLNTYANFTTNYITRNLDKVLLGWKYGSQSLGFYDRAYYLFVMPVNQISYPLTNVAVATLSRLRDDPEKFKRYYFSALSLIGFVGFLISTVLTINGKNIMIFLLGSEWVKAGDLFSLFGPGIAVLLIYGTHGWLHLALGRPERWVKWGVVELIITAGFFLIGLKYGASGIVVAYVGSIYLIFIPGLYYAGKPIGIDIGTLLSCFWRYLIAAGLSGYAAWFLINKVAYFSVHYLEVNLLVKILVGSTTCSMMYLMMVILLYGSFQPITNLISIGKEMLPNR